MSGNFKKKIPVDIIISSALLLIIIAAFMAYSIYTSESPGFFDVQTETELMPDIVGYSFNDVKLAYYAYFDVVCESIEYSDKFEEGTILSQSIPVGTEFIVGDTTVNVTVSNGKKPEKSSVTAIWEENSSAGTNTNHQ